MYVKRFTNQKPFFMPHEDLYCLPVSYRNMPDGTYSIRYNNKIVSRFTSPYLSSTWLPIVATSGRDYSNQFMLPKSKYSMIVLETDEGKSVGSEWEVTVLLDTVALPSSPDVSLLTHDTSNISYCLEAENIACPVDPVTSKPMTTCLNWRRIDDIGLECRNAMSVQSRNASATDYCTTNPTAPDCRCINRAADETYQGLKQSHLKQDDHCWFPACRDGHYLVEDTAQMIECDSEYCRVQMVGTDMYGSKIYSEIQQTSCAELASQQPQVEKPTAEKPVTEEPKQQGPTQDPVTEEPKQQGPTQDPVTEEPKQDAILEQRRVAAMIIVVFGTFFIVTNGI